MNPFYVIFMGHPVNSRFFARRTYVVFVPSRGALPSVPRPNADQSIRIQHKAHLVWQKYRVVVYVSSYRYVANTKKNNEVFRRVSDILLASGPSTFEEIKESYLNRPRPNESWRPGLSTFEDIKESYLNRPRPKELCFFLLCHLFLQNWVVTTCTSVLVLACPLFRPSSSSTCARSTHLSGREQSRL
jgi:hypothetical protein